ncbi:MAG: helix-turn-helix domain-containing protein [Bdellovibrionaceae bacterium]|nr:helix-turn-helix domain-containing protein [Pseudobdellovibrionaceae bacterium]
MGANQVPAELWPFLSRYLRQARTARSLTLTQAAERIGIPAETLESMESGTTAVPFELVVSIIEDHYGGARGDAVEGLLRRLAAERKRCTKETERRKHLSLIGDDPKPWEKIDFGQVTQGVLR